MSRESKQAGREAGRQAGRQAGGLVGGWMSRWMNRVKSLHAFKVSLTSPPLRIKPIM